MKCLARISYDGSHFEGFQRLKNGRGVQNELERVVSLIHKKEVKVKGAGRTDAGVHALDQCISFDLDVEMDLDKLKYVLNRSLSPYIAVQSLESVSEDFHARFSVKEKVYFYKIYLGEKNPFLEDYSYCFYQKLNIDKMKEASRLFVGNHDFKNLFSVQDSPKITENSINLHLKSIVIKEDLLLVGIGGATCALYTDEEFYHAYQNLDKNNIEWKGYPYIDNEDSPNYEKSDEMFKNDLQKIESTINEHKGNVLLLSHVGPFISNTSNQYEEKIIYSGSPSLKDFLFDHEDKIIANVHGHTHDAQGLGKIREIKVCNPGAVLKRRFGILKLIKNIESNYKWKIEKYQQINLID